MLRTSSTFTPRIAHAIVLTTLLAVACSPAGPPRTTPTAAPKAAAKPVEQKPPSATPAAQAQAQPAAKAETRPATPEPSRGGTLRVGLNQEHKTLDPHLSVQFPERYALYAIFNTLVAMDENGQIVPELAESWELPDDRTYVLRLRKGVKFHDGADFNAAAVKWNFERILNPDTKSPQRSQLEEIAAVEAVDDSTVRVQLKRPFAPLLSNLAERAGFIVSPSAVQKYGADFGRNPVGTGPFKFVEWITEDHLTIRRFDGYWEAGKPYLDEIIYRPVPDNTVRATMGRTGELHIIDRIQPQDVATLKAEPGLKVLEFESGGWYGVQWWVDKPPFDNPKLRQAIAYAIDRDELRRVYWLGTGRVAQAPIGNGWAYYKDLQGYATDVDKGKQLLAEAGYPGGFRATLVVNSLPDQIREGELLKSQLAKIGVTVDLETVNPNDSYAKVVARETNWTLTNWTLRPDPHGLLFILFHSKGFANTTGYKNEQVDALLEQAMSSYDQKQRQQLYFQAQQLIVQDAPYIFFWHPSAWYAMSQKVQNFKYIPDDVMRVRDLWLSP